MSVLKPYTRGGRTLYVVRPKPKAPPPILALFLALVLSPARGVAAVVRAGPKLGALTLILAVVGLLRGLVEAYWYYLMTGQAHELPALLARPDWYTRYGGPFVLVNIPSAHFLWFTTALILYIAARLLGGTGSIRRTLQVTGVALIAYLPIGLINYLHVWLELPSVTLETGAFFAPNLGVGQLAVFLWITVVAYHALRQVHGLSPGWSALAAPLPVLSSLVLYLASAGFFFRLAPYLPGARGPGDWLSLANLAYLLATAGLTGLMALGTQRWTKAGEGNERHV